jgi:hypothetical protein
MKYENNEYRKCFAKIAKDNTECVTDLDLQSEMLIFKSILTTFKFSIIFEADGAVV